MPLNKKPHHFDVRLDQPVAQQRQDLAQCLRRCRAYAKRYGTPYGWDGRLPVGHVARRFAVVHGLADGPHFDFWHAAYNVASSDYYVGPYG
jgi:hypothetical protein